MSTLTLDPKSGAIKVQTPYNASLVAAIKTLPTTARKYDPTSKTWLVDPSHGAQVARWIETYLDEVVLVPQILKSDQKSVTEIFEVRYIGTTKDRGEQERSAFGFVLNEWSIVFPENVLRVWFDQEPTPADETNLYAILSVSQLATLEVIKQNHRRLARQWHPDVCKEPNAQETFIKIQHAYEILSDPRQRAKYDAGLTLAARIEKRSNAVDYSTGYRSPLRCGLILAEGIYQLGRFDVSKILQWEDITNSRGQTLVVSWQAGADMFSEAWV